MNTEKPPITSESVLEEVRQQFKNWRKTKTGRECIPQSLWQAAAEVFQLGDHSLHQISKTLHLNQTALKKHVHQLSLSKTKSALERKPKVSSESSPTFIELELNSPASVSESVIEMEDASGAKMRICFRGKTDPNFIEICKSFWRQRA